MNLSIIRILSLMCLVSLNLWHLVFAIDILVTHHSNADDVFGEDSPRRIDQSLPPPIGPAIKYVQSTPPLANSGHYHDPLNVDHSNLFYIEEGADTHELTSMDYGHGHYPHSSILPTSYDTGSSYGSSIWPSTSTSAVADKKSSKFFTEEVSFVVAVVTLAVFLCFLSSVFIPLAVLLFSSGTGIAGIAGLSPFAGLQNLLSGTNTMLNGGALGNIGTMVTMGKRRRRKRSTIPIDHNLFDSYLSRFYKALNKFN